jgi:hypothetical protein
MNDRRANESITASLRVLANEYHSLSTQDRSKNSEAAAAIQAVIARLDPGDSSASKRPKLSRDDARTVARLLVELYPPEQLGPRAQQIAHGLRDFFGEQAISPAIAEKLANIDALPESDRRAIVRELERRRASFSVDFKTSEVFRADVLRLSLYAATFCLAAGVVAFALLAARCAHELAIFPIAGVFGAFGAWISVAARIRDAEPVGLARHAELNEAPTSSVWLSPVFGAIGAILIVGAMKTKILGGDLAPDFSKLAVRDCNSAGRDAILNVLTAFTSTESFGIVFALALVALAAGWTERLVPDLLEWVSKRTPLPRKE